jgi:hypothetical protein
VGVVWRLAVRGVKKRVGGGRQKHKMVIGRQDLELIVIIAGVCLDPIRG